MMERSEVLERIAVLTAVKKQAEDDLAELRALIEDEVPPSGKVPLMLGEESVGSIGRRWSAPRTELVCTDDDAFLGWLCDDGRAYLFDFLQGRCRSKLLEACASALIVDGEVPAGCKVVEVPSMDLGIAVYGCKPKAVEYALGMALPQAAERLLGDGRDG